MKPGISSKITSVFSVLVIAATIAVSGAITTAGSELLMDAAVKRLEHSTQIAGMSLSGMIDAVSRDTVFLTHTKAVERIAQAHGEDQRPAGGPGWRDDLADIFSAILESRPWYFQVRLIGVQDEGREIVRVERADGQIQRTPENRLQGKAHRPYFEETVKLPAGGFYLSKVDLNREHGRISEPHIPTLRGARPIYSKSGKLFGFVIINVDMRPVFEAARSLLDPEASLYIANEQGDFVFHPDSTKTFGFDLGDRHLVQDEIPEIKQLLEGWTLHMVADRVRTVSGADSVAYFERVPLVFDGGQRFLVLGVSTPRDTVLEHVDEIRKRGAAYTFLFSFLAVLLAISATRILTKPLRQMTQSVGRLVRGQHEAVLPVERNDEIGERARGFQFLANKLNSERGQPHK